MLCFIFSVSSGDAAVPTTQKNNFPIKRSLNQKILKLLLMPLVDHSEHVQATRAALEEQQEHAAQQLLDRLNQESVSTESLVEARLSAVINKAHDSNLDVFEGHLRYNSLVAQHQVEAEMSQEELFKKQHAATVKRAVHLEEVVEKAKSLQ